MCNIVYSMFLAFIFPQVLYDQRNQGLNFCRWPFAVNSNIISKWFLFISTALFMLFPLECLNLLGTNQLITKYLVNKYYMLLFLHLTYVRHHWRIKSDTVNSNLLVVNYSSRSSYFSGSRERCLLGILRENGREQS